MLKHDSHKMLPYYHVLLCFQEAVMIQLLLFLECSCFIYNLVKNQNIKKLNDFLEIGTITLRKVLNGMTQVYNCLLIAKIFSSGNFCTIDISYWVFIFFLSLPRQRKHKSTFEVLGAWEGVLVCFFFFYGAKFPRNSSAHRWSFFMSYLFYRSSCSKIELLQKNFIR